MIVTRPRVGCAASCMRTNAAAESRYLNVLSRTLAPRSTRSRAITLKRNQQSGLIRARSSRIAALKRISLNPLSSHRTGDAHAISRTVISIFRDRLRFHVRPRLSGLAHVSKSGVCEKMHGEKDLVQLTWQCERTMHVLFEGKRISGSHRSKRHFRFFRIGLIRVANSVSLKQNAFSCVNVILIERNRIPSSYESNSALINEISRS